MHPVLHVQEVKRVPCLDQSGEERGGTIYFEGVGRAELLLVTDKYDLLGMDRTQERLVLFDHGSFVNNDSCEPLVPEILRAGFAHCRNNDWPLAQNLILKLTFVLHENLKLSPVEHFDLFNIVTEEVDIPFIELQLPFSNVEDFEWVACLTIHYNLFHVDYGRELHHFVKLTN